MVNFELRYIYDLAPLKRLANSGIQTSAKSKLIASCNQYEGRQEQSEAKSDKQKAESCTPPEKGEKSSAHLSSLNKTTRYPRSNDKCDFPILLKKC